MLHVVSFFSANPRDAISKKENTFLKAINLDIMILVGGLEHFLFSIICGVILPID